MKGVANKASVPFKNVNFPRLDLMQEKQTGSDQ